MFTYMSAGNFILSTVISSQGTRSIPMTPSELDLDCMRRIASGDDSALRALYAAYGQRLYSYALRITGDAAQAEDVLQDVLVTLWRRAGDYRGQGRLIAWLLTIVHHTALKSLRHPSIEISDEIEATWPSCAESPEIQVQDGQRCEWVRRALQSLSPDHRAVLELVFYQGLCLQEVADVCGCPLGTVKSRLSYARQHLHGVLSRQDVEEWR